LHSTGSKAYLFGTYQKNLIELHHSADRRKEVIDLSGEIEADDGHGGGDSRFIKKFAACIRDGTEPAADLSAGLASTVIACAIEAARSTRSVVEIPASRYEA
jgi:hypothetical protein